LARLGLIGGPATLALLVMAPVIRLALPARPAIATIAVLGFAMAPLLLRALRTAATLLPGALALAWLPFAALGVALAAMPRTTASAMVVPLAGPAATLPPPAQDWPRRFGFLVAGLAGNRSGRGGRRRVDRCRLTRPGLLGRFRRFGLPANRFVRDGFG